MQYRFAENLGTLRNWTQYDKTTSSINYFAVIFGPPSRFINFVIVGVTQIKTELESGNFLGLLCVKEVMPFVCRGVYYENWPRFIILEKWGQTRQWHLEVKAVLTEIIETLWIYTTKGITSIKYSFSKKSWPTLYIQFVTMYIGSWYLGQIVKKHTQESFNTQEKWTILPLW